VIRLYLLGRLGLTGPEGCSPERVLAGDLRTAMLAVLALSMPHARRRDSLVGIFWPDASDREARHRLRQVLYVLRTALGEAAFIGAGTEQVGLDPEHVWCDATAFQEAMGRGDHSAALEHYGGTLCDGLFVAACPGFEHWLSEQRERLQEQMARAAWQVTEEAERAGDLRAACDFGARALRHQPDEERLCWLLTVHERAADRIGAIRLMDRFERDLAEQYELDVSPATRAIMDRILASGRGHSGPSRPDTAPPSLATHRRSVGTPERQ
jgi:DNA-binding SARP family transcriptional activator